MVDIDISVSIPVPLLEISTIEDSTNHTTNMKWYSRMYRRVGVWKHLTSPLYILVVLYLSILLIPIDLLSITWYPRVYYLTNQSISAGICILPRNNLTLAFNIVPVGKKTDILSSVLHSLMSHLSSCSVLADTFANAFNFSILVGIVICPVTGLVLGFRASRSKWSDRRKHGYLRYHMRM